MTSNWIRVWKIHGSLSWFWKRDPRTNTDRIVRLGQVSEIDKVGKELVIYPSKEKYDTSRKQPFIAYFDRLRNFLLSGELLFIFTGYSFADQHINEIVFNCLRQNSRLTALVFAYQDAEVERLSSQLSSYLNVLVFGPTKAIINGTLGEWEYSAKDLKPSEKSDTFWDEAKGNMKLGEFTALVNFVVVNSGKADSIEAITNAK